VRFLFRKIGPPAEFPGAVAGIAIAIGSDERSNVN